MPATVFDKPIFPGAKIVLATLTVENTSGSYSETVTDDRISASMKAYALEIDDPSIFGDKISVTAGAGEFTIECDDVAGSTTVKISFLKVLDDPTAVTSTEFDILENRIGDLSDLTTTVKTDLVNSVNEVNAHLGNLQMVQVSKTVSLPANADTDIDVSQFVPAGKTIFGISAVMLGDYYLPYIGSNNSRTWVEHVYPETNKVRIKNTATAWTNYVLTFVLFVV